MKKAIAISVAGDSRWQELASYTVPTIQAYADKVDAELVYLPRLECQPILMDKFGVKEVLDRYDRVLTLDIDVIVRPDCPDLFELVPEGYFAAYNEIHRVPHIKHDLLADRQRVARENGKNFSLDPDLYLNTGVFLCDRSHQEAFAVHPKECRLWGDQAWLNVRVQELGFKVRELPQAFNGSRIHNPRYLQEYWVVHYCGDSMEDRLDMVPADLERWRNDFC